MGVKYGKEYEEILNDLTGALKEIPGSYEFLGMEESDWADLPAEEQHACMKTLADDVFYGLGADPVMELGTSVVTYDAGNHIIKVAYPENLVRLVYLV